MLSSAVPDKFPLYWAVGADPAYVRDIPEDSQIGVQDGAASLTTGFPPDTFTQIAAGGTPPFGTDFNGIFRQITQIQQWQQAGGQWKYDSAFATAIGGYPSGAILQSNVVLTRQWQSFVDSNLTDPDDPLTSVGWLPVGIPPGTPILMPTSDVVPGYLPANALTIGNASSNGTLRANSDTLFLYAANWFRFSATACPIYTSAGVLTTRGANPYADFTANKALAMPDMKGRGVIGIDTMGGAVTTRLSGVPFSIGNATTPGSFCGENLHQLTTPEIPAITPAGTITNGAINLSFGGGGFIPNGSGNIISNSSPGGSFGTTGSVVASQGASTFSGTSFGGSGSHNTVEQNLTGYWNMKL